MVWTTFPQSQAMVAPLAQGQLDGMGASVSAGIYNAIGAGIPIKIVGDRGIDYAPYGALPLVVRTDLIKSGRASRRSPISRACVSPNPAKVRQISPSRIAS